LGVAAQLFVADYFISLNSFNEKIVPFPSVLVRATDRV